MRVQVAAASVTNPQVGFRLATSGDAIVVDFTQLEQKGFVSSPVVTTTATRGRGNEMPSFNDDGASYNDGQRLIDTTHFNKMPLSMFVEFCGNFDGVNVANVNRVATRQTGGGSAICLNAGVIATSADNKVSGSNTDDHLGLGNRGAGDQALNGYIRRLTFWRRELTDGEMLDVTR